MCGIVGVFNKQSPTEVKRMLKKIKHRGPNGQGVKNLPGATLGHTRLSIIDLEGGHQPMGYQDTWIAFNGEIYNYRELAREYLADIKMKTHSDTEVVIHLYRKFGPKFVELLQGMFAFAIVEGDELFMARDPLGIKPLYHGERDGGFYFASEIKAMALVTDEIHEFPAGHWYHSHKGWKAFYRVDPDRLDIQHEEQAIDAIQVTLAEAVRLRMIADVPVGISLSGGLDSSIIASLASQGTEHLHSFVVGMEGSEDLSAARTMADCLGTQHHERIYTDKEMLEALPQVIYHLESFDPALVRSAIPNYFLAQMASKYVKVILTGEGADEIFAGYDYLSDFSKPGMLQQEMLDITASLHNTNLQRADRVAMAFGLEARVPFLDMQSVALGLGMPDKWKANHNRPAKYLLRRAFSHSLPEEITYRPKQKFSKGAGSADVIAEMVEREISTEEFSTERVRLLQRWNYRLPNKEALYYFRILRQFYQEAWIFPSMGHSHSL
ncbi:MAG: asparagine synthase B [Anaerolineaceae bacterium]|nr:asparagine synthase B [Anaerolineaceae bacterium]